MAHFHYIQHVPFEGLGIIEQQLKQSGHQMSRTRFYLQEQPPPASDYDCLIIMGGPMSAYQTETYPWLQTELAYIQQVMDSNTIILGICLGAQLLATALGATVKPNGQPEIGWFDVHFNQNIKHSLLAPLAPLLSPKHTAKVLHWHSDTFDIPAQATLLASSAACVHQAFAVEEQLLGLQFHLEMTPESLQQIIQHCPIKETGPYLQTEAQLMAQPNYFFQTHQMMFTLIKQICKLLH